MRERDLFIEALEKEDPHERAALLDQVCQTDAGLRGRVEALLANHDRQGRFILDTPPPGLDAAGDQPMSECAGTRIGPYKLLEQIGEGGFGVVFLAEQERPVRRRVALKIIKPGMDTRACLARFEAERQALALMDHPNIAKVFDAGTTGAPPEPAAQVRGGDGEKGRGGEPDLQGSLRVSPSPPLPLSPSASSGRPYFVMELIQGVPITDYCDLCHLTTRERLELLITVCQAVQHAHQKGVIHRDIKPTNVLVAMQDGRPAPNIIDFGVAKALNQRLTEHTLATGFAQIIGTPLYMSPEQAELSPLGADTRSDIYSLGVLLYELLTGTTPFDKDRLHAAGFDELRRIIREDEPPRPSTRVSTLAAEVATTVAEHRRTDAHRLLQTVRGELDWIVMKCLEKDRNRRYETASALAQDLKRYLANEPVQACPPSATYRLGKFARRNWAALTVALAIVTALLLLVVGLAASNRLIAASRSDTARALHQKELALAAAKTNADEAEAQRRRAEESSRKALTAVRDLLISPAISHAEWTQIPAPLRRKFRDEAATFYGSLLQGGTTDPSLRYETAVGQRALGYLFQQTDGVEQAESLLRQSVEILEGLHRESPDNLDYQQQLASSHFTFFQTLWWQRRFDNARASQQRAIDLYEGLMAEQADLPTYANEAYGVYLSMGHLLAKDLGRPDDAERMYLRAIEIHEQRASRFPSEPFSPSERVKAYEALAALHLQAGRLEAAADLHSRVLQVAPDDPRRWYGAAAVFLSVGDMDRYRSACLELLGRAEKLAANHPNVADWAAKTCALAPDSVSDFSRVQRLAARCVTGTENHAWRRNFTLAKALTDYRAGRHEEALQWLGQFAPQIDGEHFDATAFATLALAHHRLKHKDEARVSLISARAIIANKPPDAMSGAFWFDWLHCEILCREAEIVAK